MTNQEHFPFPLPFQINLHNEDQNETRKVIKTDFSFRDKKRKKEEVVDNLENPQRIID